MSDINPKDAAAANKCPMWLLPPVAIEEMAYVLGHGATKYGEWNWREGPIHSKFYLSALLRHFNAYMRGEDIDPESGQPHLSHMSATCAILRDAQTHGTMIDDRPGATPCTSRSSASDGGFDGDGIATSIPVANSVASAIPPTRSTKRSWWQRIKASLVSLTH